MNTPNILVFLIGALTILVNIGIAIYNVGKNRKIYEIFPMVNGSKESVNDKLKSGDYTILYVGPGKQLEQTTYILGKVKREGEIMNKKQLVVVWLMAIPICFIWIDWTINYLNPAKNLTAALIATHIVTGIIGGLLIYTWRDKKR